jgi:4-hydroxy-4-methyl-2-oxoglutarate aldolase
MAQSSQTRISQAFERFSTCDISDALDRLEIRGVITGIYPLWSGCPKIVGRAMTLKLSLAGHKEIVIGSLEAVDAAQPGDIMIIDNRGRLDINSWGGLVSFAAMRKGLVGAVIDGATRDLDEFRDLGFPVYARGTVPTSVRGRVAIEDYNVPVQCGTVPVNPGDLIVADGNGVVVVPRVHVDAVQTIATRILEVEARIRRDIERDVDPIEAHKKHRYVDFLEGLEG